MNNNSLIKINNVSYWYDANEQVLKGINLDINHGDFIAMIGPNGSGKSTLIKCILGVLKPKQGKISYASASIAVQMNYVSQKAGSFQTGFPATVREVVASGLYGRLGLLRRMQKKHWSQVEQALQLVDMDSYMHRHIGKLSGGQQQRVFIARALVSEPSVLILDEPTIGVDKKSLHQFYHLLKVLNTNKQLTIILATHDIEQLNDFVDRVICLNQSIQFSGDVALFAQNQQKIISDLFHIV